MKVLAIETSCDETAIALVEAKGGLKNPQFQVLKNVVSSQVKIHRPFGGVVPSLAKREHIRNLSIVLEKLVNSSKSKVKSQKSKPQLKIQKFLKNVDLIAVTVGPGLEPALWTGINFAKDLAKQHKKPLIGVNHLEGHMYSFLLSQRNPNFGTSDNLKISDNVRVVGGPNIELSKIYPAIVLIVSGGHTILVHQKNLTTWKKIGETRDDASGEAFDKVARLLGLTYPGGPELEKLALGGNPNAIEFPRPMIHQKNYDFSFSGLKTAVLYYLRQSANSKLQRVAGEGSDHLPFAISNKLAADVAASFQQAIIDVLVQKTMRAAAESGACSVILSGGVASNKALRKRLQAECRKNNLAFLSAERKYQTDNAAMIAAAAYVSHLRDKRPRKIALRSRGKLRLTARANLNL